MLAKKWKDDKDLHRLAECGTNPLAAADPTVQYLLTPYNGMNQPLPLSFVQSFLHAYGIEVWLSPESQPLFQRAFVHRSYLKRVILESDRIGLVRKPSGECMELCNKSYERYEYLGDGILECVTKCYLYTRFPNEQEGFLTDKKIAIVNNKSIGQLAIQLGLHPWLVISAHYESVHLRDNLDTMGCVFEAFLGALFMYLIQTLGYGVAFQHMFTLIQQILERHVDWSQLLTTKQNYKTMLQELLQKEFKQTPEYRLYPPTEVLVLKGERAEGREGGGGGEKEPPRIDEQKRHFIKQYTSGVFLCLGNVDKRQFDVNKAVSLDHLLDTTTKGARLSPLDALHRMQKAIAMEGGHRVIRLGIGSDREKRTAEKMASKHALESLHRLLNCEQPA